MSNNVTHRKSTTTRAVAAREKVSRILIWAISAALLMSAQCISQKRTRDYPRVISGDMPQYPGVARIAGIQGKILLNVETAGESVAKVTVTSDSGQSILAQVAEANVKSWKFEKHDHDKFTVDYEFVLKHGAAAGVDAEVVLRLPTYVKVISRPWPRGEPDRGQEIGPPSK